MNKEKIFSKKYNKILRHAVVGTCILNLLSIPVVLLNAVWLSDMLDAATTGDVTGVLCVACCLLLLLLLSKSLLTVGGIHLGKSKSKAVHRCKQITYEHLFESPLYRLYHTDHGAIMRVLHEDFGTVIGRIINTMPTLLCGLITMLFYVIFLCQHSPWLALVMVGISLLQIIPPFISKHFFEKLYVDCQEIEAEVTNAVFEYCHGFSTIKIFQLQSWCLNRHEKIHKRYLKVGNLTSVVGGADDILGNIVGNILTYGTYAIVGWFVLCEYITMETGVVAIALSGSLYGTVNSVMNTIPDFGLSKVAEGRMISMLGKGESLIPPSPLVGGFRLDNVSCSLGDKQILHHVTFEIKPETISLIQGVNGVGKSTLFKVAVGLLVPEKGSVCFGGAQVDESNNTHSPQELFYLPQEDAVYHLTSAELFNMVDGIDAKIASDYFVQFGCDPVLLTQEMDTLSGGERKKVFLALAFALNPILLLLDEPTNSLDEKGRDVLCELLKTRKGTTAMITHDPRLRLIAKHIYTVTEGGITHEVIC